MEIMLKFWDSDHILVDAVCETTVPEVVDHIMKYRGNTVSFVDLKDTVVEISWEYINDRPVIQILQSFFSGNADWKHFAVESVDHIVKQFLAHHKKETEK